MCIRDRVVPLQAEFFALEGLTQLMKTIERIKNNLNQNKGKIVLFFPHVGDETDVWMPFPYL